MVFLEKSKPGQRIKDQLKTKKNIIMKKFAIILSGCGVYDGAEIHEATLTMLAIKKQGADYVIFAPNKPQHHVINHFTGEPTGEQRNVLEESARIARGNIQDLKEFNAREVDALIMPGGFGVAKNLTTWAFDGPDGKVDAGVSKAIRDMVSLQKPVGALCISPVLLAQVLGKVEITIGNDKDTIAGLEKAGATHIVTSHGEVVRDPYMPVFTTPCYMLDASIVQIAEGCENIVKAMLVEMNG